MFKTILVPVDGSPFSEQALRQAERIAKEGGGQIELLSVLVQYSSAMTHVPKLEQASERMVEGYLAKLAQEVRDAGVEVGHRVRRGMPAAEIVAVAHELRADLIVMASHGVGAAGPGAPSYGLGGVTFKVLHDAPCPVLVTRIHPEQ